MPPLSIDSNATGLAFVEEASLKTLPGSVVWQALEPNSYPDFGASYTLIARTPITNTRQKTKGVVTDLDVKAGFNIDLTKRNLQSLLQGFFWATMIEKADTEPINGTQIELTAITTTQFQAAAGLTIFHVGDLGFAENTGVAANDGVFPITVVASGALTTTKTLVAVASPPANAKVQTCGFIFTASDATLAVSGPLVTLGTTTKDLTQLGLTRGDWVWIGGDATLTKFATGGSGFARVFSVAAHALVFDLTNFAAANDTATDQTIEIFFGKYLRNAKTATEVVRRSYTLERQLGNDGIAIQAEYALGCIPDQATFNFKEAAKLDLDLSFVGMDVLNKDGTAGILAGTRVDPLGEDAFNTSLDQVMQRLYVVDPTNFNPTALYGYASDAKLVINNGVKPNKALGVLGAFEASASYFDVSGTLTAYFTTVDSVASIRASGNVGWVIGMAKQNYGFIFDIPLLALGGGLNKVEQDKPVMVDLTQSAAKAPGGYTAAMVFFPYLPNQAMPV